MYTMDIDVNEMGLGRVGRLAQPMTLRQFAEHVKTQLDVPFVRIVGDGEAVVSKVAVVGGDGNKYIYVSFHLFFCLSFVP